MLRRAWESDRCFGMCPGTASGPLDCGTLLYINDVQVCLCMYEIFYTKTDYGLNAYMHDSMRGEKEREKKIPPSILTPPCSLTLSLSLSQSPSVYS